MYLNFFGMRQKPFGATPQLGAYYPTQSQEEATATLRYAVTQGRGIGVLIGDTGLGKTMVCHRLANCLDAQFTTGMITNTNMSTVKAFMQAILYDLALPFHGMDEQDLRLSLTDFLLGKFAAGHRTVLIIDEAQNLAPNLLEEIRMLSNLEGENDKLIHIVLSGQPRLGETLRRTEFAPFNQRVGARATLTLLNEMETTGYVRCQLRYAGIDPESVFTSGAYAAIYEATEGVPRVLNQLGEHALIVAFAQESRVVTEAIVESAWNELRASTGGTLQTESLDGRPRVQHRSRKSDVGTSDTELEPTLAVRKSHPNLAVVDGSARVIPLNEDAESADGDAIAETRLAAVHRLDRAAVRRATHPAEEAFDEEEVVLDAYATLNPSKRNFRIEPPEVKNGLGDRNPTPTRTAKPTAPAPASIPITTTEVSEPPRRRPSKPSPVKRPVAAVVCTDDEPATFEVGAAIDSDQTNDDTDVIAPVRANRAAAAKPHVVPQSNAPAERRGQQPSDSSILVIDEGAKANGRSTARVDMPSESAGRGPGVYRRLFTLAKKS